jgi:acetylornithine/N-succinyldiaminopimelate aminotransferase
MGRLVVVIPLREGTTAEVRALLTGGPPVELSEGDLDSYAAFVSSRDILSAFRNNPPLSHVTTFGGHPVSCAAGHAALNVLMEENLPDRALEIGQHIRRRIVHTLIREVRGLGCMLGMELISRKVTERVAGRCLEAGVLLGWTLHSDTVVRLAPPLNIPMEVLDEALDIILEQVSAVEPVQKILGSE